MQCDNADERWRFFYHECSSGRDEKRQDYKNILKVERTKLSDDLNVDMEATET